MNASGEVDYEQRGRRKSQSSASALLRRNVRVWNADGEQRGTDPGSTASPRSAPTARASAYHRRGAGIPGEHRAADAAGVAFSPDGRHGRRLLRQDGIARRRRLSSAAKAVAPAYRSAHRWQRRGCSQLVLRGHAEPVASVFSLDGMREEDRTSSVMNTGGSANPPRSQACRSAPTFSGQRCAGSRRSPQTCILRVQRDFLARS